MNYSIVEQLAKIAIAKSLVKEYKTNESERTVYLNNGTEFQIYLKNPYQKTIGVKVYVNDDEIGGILILKPGQSCWLERFLNNDKKFLFSTYEVENTQEMRYAINKNGKVRIEFFQEKTNNYDIMYRPNNYIYPSISVSSSPYPFNTSNTSSNTSNDSLVISCCTNNLCNDAINYSTSLSASLQTGRIENGSKSNQKFKSTDINLEYTPFKTECIQILPNSRKQVSVNETRRKYCSQCGKKVSPKDKYCSNCGAKLI